MKRYIAFLRGINVGGKNKISMPLLKECFEEIGFYDVITVLNSGNVIFSSDIEISEEIRSVIKDGLKTAFLTDIDIFVISKEELEDIVNNAPSWWDDLNNEIYDNIIFIIPPAEAEEVLDKIGPAKEGLEKTENYKQAIFWSFVRKDYQKTNWWRKTSLPDIGGKLTIRTAQTVKKILKK